LVMDQTPQRRKTWLHKVKNGKAVNKQKKVQNFRAQRKIPLWAGKEGVSFVALKFGKVLSGTASGECTETEFNVPRKKSKEQ